VSEEKRLVARVIVDVTQVYPELGLGSVVHDLTEDEQVCLVCKGLGLHKTEQVYGLRNEGDQYQHWNDPFPYKDQYLVPCGGCYAGKAKFCELCEQVIDRHRSRCECKGATALRDAADREKEGARRAKLPRIKLVDYDCEMVYSDATDEYILTEEVTDHLVDHEGDTLFACTLSKASIEPSADDVIESIERMADEEVEDGSERILFKPGAREALDAALAVWFAEYVESPDVFWENSNLIVDVPGTESSDDE